MGGVLTYLFGSREPQTPIKSPGERIINVIKTHFRGIFGVLVPLIVVPILMDKDNPYKTVGAIWFWMFWFFLLQPIAVNATGLITIFAFPMFGILTSDVTIDCIFNEHILLFFIAGWLLLTLNCSGVDRHIALYFLSAGGNEGFSAIKILLKSTMAAFILSMISSRTMGVASILDIVLPSLNSLATYANNEANYKEFIPILCNAIATSASFGSICVVHASLTTLQFKAMFTEVLAPVSMEYPDIFNYLQYSAYAVPTAVAMYIVNIVYHIVLIKVVVENKKRMSTYSMTAVKNSIHQQKNSIGKWTHHQMVATFLLALCFVCLYTRWSTWLSMGWSTFRREASSPDIPGVKDATTAAIFVFIFHLLPKSLNFLKIFTVKSEKDAPLKQESGVLFFKFVDKNIDYSYCYVMGGAMALYRAVLTTGLGAHIKDNIGDYVTGLGWNGGILVVVTVSVFLANIISGCGAQAAVMPLFVAIATAAASPWPERLYLVILGTGLATGFGFTVPFRDTTCYYTKTIAKVPRMKQVKYAIVSVLVCSIILYLTLLFYAPILWDPNGTGVTPLPAPDAGGAPGAGTTPAPEPDQPKPEAA